MPSAHPATPSSPTYYIYTHTHIFIKYLKDAVRLGELHVAGHAGREVVDHEGADDGLAVLPFGRGGREPVGEDEGRLLGVLWWWGVRGEEGACWVCV